MNEDKIEVDLLVQRIKDGGFSGEYLKDAYISTYRNVPFLHSLGDLIKLDVEGVRLFYQILNMRKIKGWSDENYYQVEQTILNILRDSRTKTA